MSELTPITRTETFLAKAGGQSVETPTPITREETFLQAIIDNGGGGGGGGGDDVMVVTLTYDEDANDGSYTSSATATEISTANRDGKVIIGFEGAYTFFVTVIDFMGDLSISGISVISAGSQIIHLEFTMNTTTNKWTQREL